MRLVRAEETVAAKIPAVTIGPKPDTMAMTCTMEAWVLDINTQGVGVRLLGGDIIMWRGPV